MVEQPKYLEMTLSQLKAYVESSESKVLLVVELMAKELSQYDREVFSSGLSLPISPASSTLTTSSK